MLARLETLCYVIIVFLGVTEEEDAVLRILLRVVSCWQSNRGHGSLISLQKKVAARRNIFFPNSTKYHLNNTLLFAFFVNIYRVANAVNLDAGEVLLYSGHLADCIANGNADDIAGAASNDQVSDCQSCRRGGAASSWNAFECPCLCTSTGGAGLLPRLCINRHGMHERCRALQHSTCRFLSD